MNRKITVIVLALASTMLASSLVGIVLASPYTSISVQDARRMMIGNKYPDLLVIDVRPDNMFNAWHIRGALNVPMAELAAWITADAGSHADDEIIVYCLMELASQAAAQILDANGYTKVYSMIGGFSAWIEAGYPTSPTIGPLRALIVGKNPKAYGLAGLGVVMLDDVGPNNIMWANAVGLIVNNADASKGGGRMNNAIEADHDTVVAMQADQTLYENKWVYLSGTGGEQWNGHGMWYWMILPMFGPAASAELEQEYSDGVFSIRNLVGK
ncbi:MAG: rhodanese-like domain-containing protein [Candidatus Bathyarchaeota archaeon]|nr:rhodanese-like domain-containing protein [Candidatus Bathyarchaeota archaeon]